MTAVLLVADTERVKGVFAELESKGVLQLHAAATLTQVDQVLAKATPAFAFVQDRISGLSAEILLRHLKKTLPETVRIVLLLADPGNALRRQVSETPPVDLRLPDQIVADTVAGIVSGTASPFPKESKSAARGKKRGKPAPHPKKDGRLRQPCSPSPRQAAATVAASAPCPPPARGGGAKREGEGAGEKEEIASAHASAAVGPPPARGDGNTPGGFRQLPPFTATALVRDEPPSCDAAAATASALAGSPAGKLEGAEGFSPLSFHDMMEAASSKTEPEIPRKVEDHVCISTEPDTAEPQLSSHRVAQETGSPEAELRSHAEDLLQGEDQVDEKPLVRAKERKPLWPFLLLLAFFLVPATAYLLGRVAEAPEKEAPQQGGKIAADRSTPFAAPASDATRPPSGGATDIPPEAPRKEESSHSSGLAALPLFLEGVEVDPGYPARHPGWEHYLGAKAEYKVFREGGRYRAIQAIARGEEIPDQLFKRVLLEFGGIAGYAVKSTEARGRYLVEQATGSGSASLTIYRRRNDHRIKGLVVYYR